MFALGPRVRRLAPLTALVAVGGCFATRADVRVVQGDIASLRTELLRNDAEARETLAQVTRALQAANDSLRVLGAREISIQGDLRGGTRSIQEQLLNIQQLLGQSTQRINQLRAEIEQRNLQQQMVPPPSPTTGTPPAGGTPPTNPPTGAGAVKDSAAVPPVQQTLGPTQLYNNGLDNLRRGSFATARTLLQELLAVYPTSDHAPNAQYYIGESYEREKNLTAADAAYAAVVAKSPDAERAPTALFKRAKIAQQQGDVAKARQLAEEVKTRYPRSDEAALVEDFLKNLK